ncbi:2-succinyl-5-enolpyruvyl-6-hydroxy-3-cyclohexene-1-carboxylic-acid synthase [Metabacillus malikii]|uniref:2-succinyl-5-enolpyruvyl-6-hydroxy-3-cyclohexene-1-carboxylate synthase n=1 Tax=Metabacillus malikii TaxID=1504265 RepID=A0ABT9ZFS7_9BACI|nr:2-succinyl-5-enolpyruvyl-6-hydroxy-3-cyclohexene-1-carboxylic-acid synthase [Metabacillus malikii]MDQ0231104.1 2-succinyl-5-enolpyruvyl-6-hydroxy-3-cyclohexene-1-carboxylate synthase [Metabacillus malikii]
MKDADTFTRYVASFVDELVSSGVDKVVISPGSRSTPLAILMAEHPSLTCYIHIDERSAGFFALGLAKSQRKPVALLCTSGTAAANYYPAIIEAHYARVPLLVLTADRPHELRDVGAPQAIDQVHMYRNYTKWFVDLALPEENQHMFKYAKTIAARAVGISSANPAGVVHLNFPLREPLLPNLQMDDLWSKQAGRETYLHIPRSNHVVHLNELEHIVQLMNEHENGLIICGEYEVSNIANDIKRLSRQLKYPVLADPLSQLRVNGEKDDSIIESYDSILRDEDISQTLKPSIVIRFGAMPISKPIMQLLKNNDEIIQIVVDSGGVYRDPTLNAAHFVVTDEQYFCSTLIESINERQPTSYYRKWITSNALYWGKINGSLNQIDELFEGKIVHVLQECLPNKSTLVVGNSMPIRDVDTFFGHTTKDIRVFANRGASGIDGIVSTALGISATNDMPTFLLIGDLSFYHDLNGLLASKLHDLNLVIILVNNDGGGIFSFLPQSKEERHFETLYGTPIGLDFSKVVEMYNGSYTKIETWEMLQSTLNNKQLLKGLHVIEIPTDRKTRVKVHRELLQNVSREIRNVLNAHED